MIFRVEDNDAISAIKLLVNWSKPISDYHISANGGKWDFDTQIARIHEEVTEVYKAMRKNEGEDRLLHECVDVIMSALAMINLIDRENGQSFKNFEYKIQKNTQEVITKLNNRIEHFKKETKARDKKRERLNAICNDRGFDPTRENKEEQWNWVEETRP